MASELLNRYTKPPEKYSVNLKRKRDPEFAPCSKPRPIKKAARFTELLDAEDLPEIERLEADIHNATKSPLFRLPVEIRDRIFRLAIGNHHVHLEHQTYRRRDPLTLRGRWYFIGPNPPRDRERTPTRSLYDWGISFNHPRSSSDCLWVGPMRPNILKCERIPALWLVCRQLHTETALYLYSLNLFSFSSYWVMTGWMHALLPIQLSNVQYLCMPGKGGGEGMLELPENTSVTFTGLKEVFVHSYAAEEQLVLRDRRRMPLAITRVPNLLKCRHTFQSWKRHAPGCKAWVVESARATGPYRQEILTTIEDWCGGRNELLNEKPKTGREFFRSFKKRHYHIVSVNPY